MTTDQILKLAAYHAEMEKEANLLGKGKMLKAVDKALKGAPLGVSSPQGERVLGKLQSMRGTAEAVGTKTKSNYNAWENTRKGINKAKDTMGRHTPAGGGLSIGDTPA